MNSFLGNEFANFLMHPVTKVSVVVVYLAVLGVAVMGIVDLEQGLATVNLTPDDSYYRTYDQRYDEDVYENYGVYVHVAIDETLDYTDAAVRQRITDLRTSFQDSNYFRDSTGSWISWLDFYLIFLNQAGQDVDSMDMPTFISVLQTQFFAQDNFQFYEADVVINSDATQITQSRFFVQSTNLFDSNDEQEMMLEARDLADDSTLEVVVYAYPFPFFDQYVVILPNTLQTLGIAVASMLVVSLILIPSLSTVVWVTLATISICACVIGYMSLWDVSLNSVSMINLVMSIGFSVDFAAHISYHYVISPTDVPRERVRDALGYLGTPIVQGALSTIIGVLALSAADTYIFRTFFKLIFMVMVFGFLHAMFLLPVLLSTLNRGLCRTMPCCKNNKVEA